MRFFGAQLTRCPRFPWIGDPVGVRDPDGRLALRGVPAGTWAVVLAGPGTAMHTIPELLVEEGATIDLGEIHMPRGQRIAGIVRDADGAPVGGARVVIGRRGLDETYQADPLRQWFECEFETLTNADGTFLFDGVTSLHPPHARPTPISAFQPARGTSVGIPVPPGDATLELTLVATGSIEGVVTGFTGFTGFPGGYVAVAAHRSGEPADLRSARVQPSGTFVLDRMPPGTYTLVMTRMPRKPVAGPVKVTVAANACTRAELVMPADDDAGADGGACGVY